jgi:hypothetical protein
VVSFLLPTFTKDVAIIWWMNALATAVCYLAAYLFTSPTNKVENGIGEEEGEEETSTTKKWLKQAFRALDYGSGQERGLRK